MLATLLTVWFAVSGQASPPSEPIWMAPTPVAVQTRVAPVREKSTPETNKLVTVTYPVADLVVPVEDLFGGQNKNAPKRTLERELITLVTTAIRPATWSANGGPGRAQYYPLGMGLVVTAEKDVQQDVAKLLKALRKLQEVEVAIDVRILALHTKTFPKIQKALGPCCRISRRKDSNKPMAILNQCQVQTFLTAYQRNGGGTVCAPRLTVFNGQDAKVAVGNVKKVPTSFKAEMVDGRLRIRPEHQERTVGTKIRVLPVVSADREFVRLGVDFSLNRDSDCDQEVPVEITYPTKTNPKTYPVRKMRVKLVLKSGKLRTLRVKGTYCVPNGNTVLIYAGKTKQKQRLASTSYVSEICDLFAIDLQEEVAQHIVLMVTPRVVTTKQSQEVCLPICLERIGHD